MFLVDARARHYPTMLMGCCSNFCIHCNQHYPPVDNIGKKASGDFVGVTDRRSSVRLGICPVHRTPLKSH